MNHIPKIIIKPIQPDNHRYPTCGDYIYDREDDTLTVFVSRMDDYRSELAVALHEVFEAVQVLHADIPISDIDLFDMQFEKDRPDGNEDEPGDDLKAPYHDQHVGATFVEREVCAQSGLSWDQHDKNVNDSL